MKHRDEILRLRAEGLSYRKIVDILGCSKSTVSFHCGEGQKEKYKKRQIKKRAKQHPFKSKIESFSNRFKFETLKKDKNSTTEKVKLKNKIDTFHKDRKNNNMYNTPTFTPQDVINKFGEHPKCYLTGQEIDIYKPSTYQFDHIVPASKGGDNSLDNLGICTKEANMSKTYHTVEEFIELCKMVLETNNYIVIKIDKQNT